MILICCDGAFGGCALVAMGRSDGKLSIFQGAEMDSTTERYRHGGKEKTSFDTCNFYCVSSNGKAYPESQPGSQ